MYLAEVAPSTGAIMQPRPYVTASTIPTLSLNGSWDSFFYATAKVPTSRTSDESRAAASSASAGWGKIFLPSHWVLTSSGHKRPHSAAYHPRHDLERGGPIYANAVFAIPITCPS